MILHMTKLQALRLNRNPKRV